MFSLNGYGRNYESDRALNFDPGTVVFNLPWRNLCTERRVGSVDNVKKTLICASGDRIRF